MSTEAPDQPEPAPPRVALATIARQWGRIGCIGFGGPPAHIALLRRLCVSDRAWLSDREFEEGIAACNLLPGPASTSWPSSAHGGCEARSAPSSAGSASSSPASGGLASATVGPWLVLVVAVCGLIEVVVAIRASAEHVLAALPPGLPVSRLPVAGLRVGIVAALPAAGGLLTLAWVGFKVGALSYGGGFVIIPLIQHDAVGTYHWMTATQFLGAVALGQVTPGPVVLTVAAVGYAAGGAALGVVAFLAGAPVGA